MRKKVVAFMALMGLTVLASQHLPGYLDLSARLVQERIMLVLLPVLLLFVWWTWQADQEV